MGGSWAGGSWVDETIEREYRFGGNEEGGRHVEVEVGVLRSELVVFARDTGSTSTTTTTTDALIKIPKNQISIIGLE